MEVNPVKLAGRLAGSMVWLCLLYGGLLYVAVGVLGVSELATRIGGESARLVHMVEVAENIRDDEREHVRREERRLQRQSDAYDVAVKDLRDFGVAHGLALQDIQPIIDTYTLAPKLSELLKAPVDPATESAWAERMARVMSLQIDMGKLKTSIDQRHTLLRANWSANADVAEAAKRINLDPGLIDLAASTADTLQRLGYGVLFALPEEILTLLLALVMGALGSTLHITRTLLDGSDPRELSYYLMRPFQGMLTSLVVFVLLKAGQLTISAGDSDALNIFFVSFAGISAGLLADEAYRMIKKAGAGIIKTEDDGARWAFKLKAALTAAGTGEAALAAGIGATPAELAAWLKEAQPVPSLQQRLIAAWLHLPERELFTSQPPDDAPPSPGAATADVPS